MANRSKHAMRVVKNQVENIELRYPNYAADLLQTLNKILGEQRSNESKQRRRSEVREQINALGRQLPPQSVEDDQQ